MELEQFDEVGRCACLKPVAAEPPVGKGIEQAERIVHTDGIFCEMIPVVVCFQLRTSFLITHARSCGQFVNILFKIGINFFLTDTADFGILVNHGNVTQVIQITEHADLAELSYSRE